MDILFINSCISTHQPSRTMTLCEKYLQQYDNTKHHITELNLEQMNLQPFTALDLQKRDALIAEGKWEDTTFELAEKVKEADRIVIGAPYWDLSFPSALKVFVEHIMICGITFYYENNAAKGLCKADELIYITTCGGYVGTQDFGYTYIEAISKMIGIPKCTRIGAEGLDIEGADVEKILSRTNLT
ncbi:MAG: NAD(P)H-dependent oxidoreductase [Lachnospiraceae bacterium]